VFFEKNSLKDLCSPVFKTSEEEELISQFIAEIDAHIVFPISSKFKNSLKSEIGHTEFLHHFASLISAYHLYYLNTTDDMAFIQFQDKSFTLCLFSKQKLVLFNTFEINGFEDVVYYTYYAIEQYGFTPSNTSIHLGGFSEHTNEITTAFQKYSSSIYHLSPKNIENIKPQDAHKLLSTIFDLQCG
jgi:hypothetical protein